MNPKTPLKVTTDSTITFAEIFETTGWCEPAFKTCKIEENIDGRMNPLEYSGISVSSEGFKVSTTAYGKGDVLEFTATCTTESSTGQ